MLNPSPYLLAFGFANVAILGWLAAAAAPILIHLWMKRVHRETPWAAVRFLQAAVKRHARRLRLQEWLLLAIRTAIILLVVFAASKPLLDSLGGLIGAGVRTHRVLVIDATLSMRLQTGDGTLLERAKRLASKLVDQSGPGDQFSLCVMAGKPTAPIAGATVDKTAVLRAIAGVEPTDAANDLGATLPLVESLVVTAEEGPANADRREVIFFSDLARTAWAPVATSGDAGSSNQIAERLTKLADRAALSLVDVGMNDATNATATSLRAASGTPTLQEPVRLVGQVQSFGAAAGSSVELPVELMVDGLAVASQNIKLAGVAPTTVTFNHRFRRPGWRRVALRLPSDQLAADDQRWLALQLKEHVDVLCVEGRRGAARYIADALNPGGDSTTAIQVRTISNVELAATNLEDFDAVFLCNVAEFTTREAARLDAYVRSGGGGAAFFLGDRVRPERYNAVLRTSGTEQANHSRQTIPLAAQLNDPSGTRIDIVPAVLQPHGDAVSEVFLVDTSPRTSEQNAPSLLPVMIGEAVSQTAYGIDPLEYQHPIVAPFRGRKRAGLLTTPVERFFKLRLPEGPTRASAVLATTSGDPLMISAPVGQGRVVVVATAGSLASVDPATGRPWTVMPAWPSFVPIVRETLRFAAGASIDRPAALVGDTIGDRFSKNTATEPEIIRPDGGQEAVAIDADRQAWSYDRTNRAGFYALPGAFKDLDGSPAQLVAINADPVESDTSRLRAADLPIELAVRDVAWEASGGAAELPQPVGVHRSLLLAALGLVLLETWLAYRFGRATA